MDPILSALQLGVMGVLATLALRTDRSPARVRALFVDGREIDGSRIVMARAHINGRAGLLNHAALAPGTGLYLAGSRAVHTRGMLFALDIVFLDANGRALSVVGNAAPGLARLSGPPDTRSVLELGAGDTGAYGIGCGSVVSFR